MEVLYKRCCGIDIHKNMLVACVFMSIRKKEIRQFGTMTDDILQLTGWLKEVGCEMVAMESTGSYWKPVYNIFEEEQVPVIVVVPECKESAGKKMSTRIRKGNKHVKSVLVECARSAIRNKKSYFYSRYQRIAARRGGKVRLLRYMQS